ncbi:MAG TPA: MFS transporter [Coriobacteriia bacterium]|nr:MFS transporter [Coriobacteriia bacterium]
MVSLALIVLGTGLLKPNVSVMVGQLYSADDPRRASGFSIFYMSINLGSFIAPLVVGLVSELFEYHIAFMIPAAMMVLALTIYTVLGRGALRGIGRKPVQPLGAGERRRMAFIALIAVVILAATVTILALNNLMDLAVVGDIMPETCTVVAAVIFFFIIRDRNVSGTERSRVLAFIPLFLAGAMFWAIAEQQSTTIALIADTHVQNHVAGFEIPPSWYASVNPLVIIIGSPILALIWTRAGNRQASLVAKMAVGLFLAFAGFVVFAVAFWQTTSATLVNPLWIVAGLTLMTVGEIFLSPTALAATTQLAPQRHISKMMSLWLISNALGQGVVALTADFFNEAAPAGFFLAFALVALIIGILLLLLQGKLLSMMKGVR